MLKLLKWVGAISVVLLAAACFMPWIYIESLDLTLTGISTPGTNFGKPGYLHFVLGPVFIVLHFIPRVWAKRTNLLVGVLNLGWAVRNFLVIAACEGGECPQKKIGLYLVLLASLIMMAATLFPDVKLQPDSRRK